MILRYQTCSNWTFFSFIVLVIITLESLLDCIVYFISNINIDSFYNKCNNNCPKIDISICIIEIFRFKTIHKTQNRFFSDNLYLCYRRLEEYKLYFYFSLNRIKTFR